MVEMKKIFALLLLLLVSGCQDKNQTISSFAAYENETRGQVEHELLDIELSPIEVVYIRERNIPYITWEEFPGADGYRVEISYSTRELLVSEDVSQRKICVVPGDEVSYRVIPLEKGEELRDYASSPLLISYSVKEGFGGVEAWQRPDGIYSYRGKKEFSSENFWAPLLAKEIQTWMRETYSDDYLLWGHIAEIDPSSDLWLAPRSPELRLEPEDWGNGLDCVGFVNGFYYLYTMAFAGEDYTIMDQDMDETHGVYGSPYSPLADYGYSDKLVIKPSFDGSYADPNHIRPGDINESHDHAWLVSHDGEGLEAKIWEYEYESGFSDSKSLGELKGMTDLPYDYWISGIGNPLESYSRLLISALDEEGRNLSGGEYRLKDLFGRTLALSQEDYEVLLYRPQGEEFFFDLFTHGQSYDFYDDEATFTSLEEVLSLERLIGGSYILEEISPPAGYLPRGNIEIKIEPGEEKAINLGYKKK